MVSVDLRAVLNDGPRLKVSETSAPNESGVSRSTLGSAPAVMAANLGSVRRWNRSSDGSHGTVTSRSDAVSAFRAASGTLPPCLPQAAASRSRAAPPSAAQSVRISCSLT